jgi:hypothetical protein
MAIVTNTPFVGTGKGAFPLQYARGMVGNEGFKGYPAVFDWSVSQGFAIKDLLRNFNLDVLSSIYVDNSQVASPVGITFLGTYFTVQVKANFQVFSGVLALPGEINCTVQSVATSGKTTIFFLNKEMLSSSWPSS